MLAGCSIRLTFLQHISDHSASLTEHLNASLLVTVLSHLLTADYDIASIYRKFQLHLYSVARQCWWLPMSQAAEPPGSFDGTYT
jgi:hypothetical protein